MVFESKNARIMLAGVIAVASLLIAGCGGGGDESAPAAQPGAPDSTQSDPRLAWDQSSWDQADWQ